MLTFERYAGGNGHGEVDGDRLTVAQFEEPYYIAYDPTRSILWVADFQTGELRKVVGPTVTTVTDPATGFGAFEPFVVRESDGYLIASGGIFDGDGQWVSDFVTPGGIVRWHGVAVASDGMIYASDTWTSTVWKSTDDGATWAVLAGHNGFGGADGGPGVGQLGEPKGLGLDEANGLLWVLDFYDPSSQNIPRVIDVTTGVISTVGTWDPSDEGVALTYHDGAAWWSNPGNYPTFDYRIETITADGTRTVQGRPAFEPAGLAFDASGRLYVANHSSPYDSVWASVAVTLGPPRIRGRNTAHPVRVRGRNAPAAVRVRGRRHSI